MMLKLKQNLNSKKRMKKSEIAKNLSVIKKEINSATVVPTLVAVTKYSPIEDVVSAYQSNHYDFGENRVADLKEKADYFNLHEYKKVRWHFIGHLQTNKVKDLFKITNLYSIHSVDSLKLLEELIKREDELTSSEVKLFFQVNTSHEEEKTGFDSFEELNLAISLLLNKPHTKLKLHGLMTMGTIRTDHFETEATRCFNDLKNVASNIEKTHGLKTKLKLSMGMSQDYKLAIAANSDYIRVGSAIFKPNQL